MKDKSRYTNGQLIYEHNDDILTYYYKNGKIKARGPSIEGKMQGEWKFYRETGQLWQIGNFKDNLKHGQMIRYDRNNQVEYDKKFNNGKLIKKE